ncbi:MAG: translation initiation factor IF-6 [Thermoplasmata archaeon]|nr:MAG: translation initiation factor IF-6 [Thermoplasmata archaeon]
MLKKLDINGNPYIGVYCHANEEFALVPHVFSKKMISQVEECLDVEVFKTTCANSSIIGVLMTSNSHGMVVTNFAEEKELEAIKDRLNILYIPDILNAVGNNILVNDKFAMVHPDIKKGTLERIQDTLDVEVIPGKIAGQKTVGAQGVVTNRGLLCHPHTTKKELELLKKRFGVNADIGTANYGTPLVGACMIANSKGAVVGSTTTPIELGRIEEALEL